MTIAAITKQGLAAIAILVAILWGCLVSERLTVQRANQEMGRAARDAPADARRLAAAVGVAGTQGVIPNG